MPSKNAYSFPQKKNMLAVEEIRLFCEVVA